MLVSYRSLTTGAAIVRGPNTPPHGRYEPLTRAEAHGGYKAPARAGSRGKIPFRLIKAFALRLPGLSWAILEVRRISQLGRSGAKDARDREAPWHDSSTVKRMGRV